MSAEGLCFSSVCGQNVRLSSDRKTAKWEPRLSGGWVHCERPLQAGQTFTVQVEGSGHYDIGFVERDPQSSTNGRSSTFAQLNEVKIHKRACRILVTLDRNGKQVISKKSSGDTFIKDTKGKIWLTVNLKFGDMVVSIFYPDNTCTRLSSNHGTNVRLEDNKQKAMTVKKNPASVCYSSSPILIGEQLEFVCEPVKDGDKDPSRYEVSLLVHGDDPESLLRQHTHYIDTAVANTGNLPVTTIECLEKEDCYGCINVSLVNETTVRYTFGRGNQAEQKLTSKATSGIWLILDLYRVTVILHKKNKRMAGRDVCDGVVAEPRNEWGENTMEHVCDSPYETINCGPESNYTPLMRIRRLEQFEQTIMSSLNISPSASSMQQTCLKTRTPSVQQTCVKVGATQDNNCSDENSSRTSFQSLENRLENIEKDFRRLVDSMEQLFTGPPVGSLEARLAVLESSLPLIRETTQGRATLAPGDGFINIRVNYTSLVADLEAKSLCDHLFQEGIIDLHEMNEIRQLNSCDANKKTLELLWKRKARKSQLGPLLQKTKQEFLINEMFPDSQDS
ncbi:uncharacterized protein LOC128231415 isoform X2 [Mya arenaria]|uniref:uncharacterized protein LOC128231415 isoform X2 n=1 Tax=Mya arenaria TaxID=6604 RepID=UPI0022E5CA11|nr:uncharacterized protein LOC128231415 isoform X2 [Mya arenaria]